MYAERGGPRPPGDPHEKRSPDSSELPKNTHKQWMIFVEQSVVSFVFRSVGSEWQLRRIRVFATALNSAIDGPKIERQETNISWSGNLFHRNFIFWTELCHFWVLRKWNFWIWRNLVHLFWYAGSSSCSKPIMSWSYDRYINTACQGGICIENLELDKIDQSTKNATWMF